MLDLNTVTFVPLRGPYWAPIGLLLGSLWGHYGVIWGHLGMVWGWFGMVWDVFGWFGMVWDSWGTVGEQLGETAHIHPIMTP